MSKASKMASIFGKTEQRREEQRGARRQEAAQRQGRVEWPDRTAGAEHKTR